MIHNLCLLMILLSSFQSQLSSLCALLKIHKIFHVIFFSLWIMLIFCTIKCPYCSYWISTRKCSSTNMFMYFCGRWFFRIISTSIYFFNQRFKICINNRWDDVLSDFQYWLNINVLVSSEGITTLQKSLFSHIFFWDSSLFFVLTEWRQFKE